VAKIAQLKDHNKYSPFGHLSIPAVNRLSSDIGARVAKTSPGAMQDAGRADPALTPR
jgi:hypothetical protein